MFKNKKITSSTLSAEIDNITKSFTTMVDTLQQKATEATEAKMAKEEEIVILQKECDALHSVSEKALSIASKIANIFN